MSLWQRTRASGRAVRQSIYSALWISCVVISINDNFLEITSVTGSSMVPALSPDYNTTGQRDLIAWRKRLPTRNLRRGDIIHFDSPTNPENLSVKRVIALPGDTVILDPRRRPTTASGDCPQSQAWDAWRGKALVPKGHVWVEGDNWRESHDSNWYGPITKSLITGKAVAWVQPLDKFGQKPSREFQTRTKVIRGKSDMAVVADIEQG